MKSPFLFALLAFPLLAACAGQIPDQVPLAPSAQDVDIVADRPSPRAFKDLGPVTGVAANADADAALEAAKNDLRNKAAAMGAALVTIDEDVGLPVYLTGKTEVKLVGRAYKPVD